MVAFNSKYLSTTVILPNCYPHETVITLEKSKTTAYLTTKFNDPDSSASSKWDRLRRNGWHLSPPRLVLHWAGPGADNFFLILSQLGGLLNFHLVFRFVWYEFSRLNYFVLLLQVRVMFVGHRNQRRGHIPSPKTKCKYSIYNYLQFS